MVGSVDAKSMNSEQFTVVPVYRKGELLLEAEDLARMNRGGTFVPEKIYSRISIGQP